MGFSFWLAGLRSFSKKSAFSNALRNSSYLKKFQFSTSQNNLPSTIAEKCKTQFFSWSSSLLPLALAASAGSLAFQSQNIQPSLCEPSNLDSRKVSIGRKSSTEFVVKGIHKEVTQELIDELKAICQRVKALHIEDMDVVVEPGIGWMELNEYLEPYGLFFPLDPGPGATIGGMCATRCSGSLAVRYGTMRDNVISLKVVLANGDIVKTASRARKSAAGYDLTRLMIGSEGTLGVVTEVTLRLQKIPEHSVVAMCNFPTIKDAADVAIATMLSGIQASRVELLDEVQVRAINIANAKNLPEVPTLMFEFIGTEAYSREQTQIVQRIVSEHNGTDFVFAEDPQAKKELWKIRKEALWACFTMEPNFEAMISDVCVPLSHLAELISRSKQELDASPLICVVIAHAGDGNFHTVILFDPNQEEHRREAERLNQFMVYTALSMEGTCTGEHGVGTGKMKYLEKELGIEALQTMKRIKTALDPNNIMNPGKLIPPHVCF
ncbi:D-lactate dehydrogenase [cytochrome], mitochondrial isoform X6 [Durio zibethinus]|uniref:D-lactate dehydrogenase (cytochrome) n=1 Tax=Durio zibethinus TaxID=66656 RepID=A0A6P6APS9_DURZI|nr:D-lactate dehydrogenase [cytochrome], mitochondrial isoform X6 [Durio zibethinus]